MSTARPGYLPCALIAKKNAPGARNGSIAWGKNGMTEDQLRRMRADIAYYMDQNEEQRRRLARSWADQRAYFEALLKMVEILV